MMISCTSAPPKSPADFQSSAGDFKALSNPSRLLTIDALERRKRCVADLTSLVGLDTFTVSNHLSVLRKVGIVKDERRAHAGLLPTPEAPSLEHLLLTR